MISSIPVMIIDDEEHMRESMSQWLSLSGFDPQTFSNAKDALRVVTAHYHGVVISDIRMPQMDGLQLLKRIKAMDPTLPVILITGHGDVPMAVEAMRFGAYSFLEKPFDPQNVIDLVTKAGKARARTLEGRALREELSTDKAVMQRFVGPSAAMTKLKEDILDFGQADDHTLIEGETGTGKTLTSHALHSCGARATKPLVHVSCVTYEGERWIERMFGSLDGFEQPAFFEARGGTLVLESVENLGDEAQLRLLSELSEQAFELNTRIISICNTQTAGQHCETVLRSDLFYRLSGLSINVTPLRQRIDDILPLFIAFCERFSDEYGCETPAISAQDAAQLQQAPWPGNVRQLRHIAEQFTLQSRREDSSLTSLLMPRDSDVEPAVTMEGKPLKELVEGFERTLIDNTMRRHKGSVMAVMGELGLPRRTLNEKMNKYGLLRSNYL